MENETYNEAELMLRALYYEDWMTDSTWNEMREFALKAMGQTIESAQAEIDKRKLEGYTFADQLSMVQDFRRKMERGRK